MKWVLVFIMLTPSGELVHDTIDTYDTIDECMISMDDIIFSNGYDEIEPYNCDFIFLQDVRHRA